MSIISATNDPATIPRIFLLLRIVTVIAEKSNGFEVSTSIAVEFFS